MMGGTPGGKLGGALLVVMGRLVLEEEEVVVTGDAPTVVVKPKAVDTLAELLPMELTVVLLELVVRLGEFVELEWSYCEED